MGHNSDSTVQGRASRVIAEVTYATWFPQHLLGNRRQTGSLCCDNKAEGWEDFLLLSALQSQAGPCLLWRAQGPEPAGVSSPWHCGVEGEAEQVTLPGHLAHCQPSSVINFSPLLLQLNGQSPHVYYSPRSYASAELCATLVAPCSPRGTTAVSTSEPALAGTGRELHVLMGKGHLVPGPRKISSPTRL